MAIKLFGKGLGLTSTPFNPGGQSTTNIVEGSSIPGSAPVAVQVDQAGISELGDEAALQPVKQTVSLKPLPVIVASTPLPTLPTAIGTIASAVARNTITLAPQVNPQVFSTSSVMAPYETLYQDFDFGCIPFYNFWTADELTNDKESRGIRKLADIPRYMKLDWDVAPTIPAPTSLKVSKPTQYRTQVPIKFGAQTTDGVGFSVKGIQFTPDHLQPENFNANVKAAVNGYIAPGVLNTRIELPLTTAGVDPSAQTQPDPLQNTDEDQYLTQEDAQGVPINSLKSLISQRASGLFGAAAVSSDKSVSAAAVSDRAEFFDGNFSVSKPLTANSQLEIRSTTASPALSFVAQTAENSEADQVDQVIDLAQKTQGPANTSTVTRSQFIRGKFVNPAVGGVVQPAKVKLMTKPEHVEVMSALASVLPNLEALNRSTIQAQPRKTVIPSFKSPPQVLPGQYVGFIIEKYARDSTGVFNKVDEFKLNSNTYSEYIDSKVVYGEIYRYRIRCLYRFTYLPNQAVFGTETTIAALLGSQVNPLASQLSSYFLSEWSPWVYGVLIDRQPAGPPDEMTCIPQSPHKRVLVTVKVPYNPKQDLYKIMLFRKLRNSRGQDLTNWKQLRTYESSADPADFGPNNCLYIDTDVDYVENNNIQYVYAAQSYTRHGEYSALSDQVGCSLTKNWQNTGEEPAILVSYKGVQITDFAPFHVYPMQKNIQERPVGTDQTVNGFEMDFQLSGRNAVGNTSMATGSYTIRVESLDTGQKFDVHVGLNYNNLPTKVIPIDSTVYVPQHNLNISKDPRVVPDYVNAPILKPLPARGKDVEVVNTVKPGTRPLKRTI
ncbi:MAG: hypothetical protein ACYDHY_07565 [Acidiferrobacterales bacterium]